MKKRLLFVLPIFVLGAVFVLFKNKSKAVTAQSYRELIQNHPLQERLKLSKQERKKKGIPPNRYFDDQYLLEMDPATGKTYPEHLEEVKNNRKLLTRFSAVPGQDADNLWVERGPNNIGGRTRVVFYDPNDASGKRVFAGGVSGGLWVNDDITNPNSAWSRVGIDENLAVSCFAIDPNDSNIWYIGTGEAYTGNDGTGNGIWISRNGGNTWSNFLPADLSSVTDGRDNPEAYRFYYVNEIVAWNNSGTTELFFSIDGGIDYDIVGSQLSGWWTVENGTTLKRVDFFAPDNDPGTRDSTSPYVFCDVEIAVDNSLWCATRTNAFDNGGGKIFRTTDGENFVEKYAFTTGDRVELTVSKTNPNKVYALAEVNSGVELVKTTDGENFIEIAKPNDVDTGISPNDFARDQAFYNLTLEVDPENDEIVYAGGIDIFRSSNGGSSWSQISKWSNNNDLKDFTVSLVHADQHAVAFNPLDSNKGVFANDGGIYYSDNLSGTILNETGIVARNKEYNITQFYSGAIGQDATSEILLGGAQDNGSLIALEVLSGINSYSDIYGGDGIESFIDKDGEYVVVSYVNNIYGAYKLPLTNSSRPIEIVDDENSGSFANVADLDHHLDILFTDGTSSGTPIISRFTNLTSTPVRRNFTNTLLEDSPTKIKVSPFTTDASTVFIGTRTATILKVTNFNTTAPQWSVVGGVSDTDGAINVGSVSDISFGTNENELLVTLHNYGINNIYYSSNGGTTWEVKDGDFPDIPVKAIKMNPLDSDEVIIGTNLGVWRTQNFSSDSPNWVQSQNGMSNVKVTKFDFRESDNTVLAATYGRGLFTGRFNDGNMTVEPTDPEPTTPTLTDKISLINTLVKTGELNVEFEDDVEGEVDFIFYATNGEIIAKENRNSSIGGNQTSIDIPFKAGVYYVYVANNGKSFVKAIIVE